MNWASLLDQYRQSLSEFWTARNSRERMILTTATMALLLVLIYALLINPALTGRKQLGNSLPMLRQQVAQLQALSKEAAAFSGKSAAPIMAISGANIEAALARSGLKPQSVMLTGDYVKIQLTAVSFAGTLNWLNEMQKSALLSVVDANIVVLTQPDMVNANLTLSRQRNE